MGLRTRCQGSTGHSFAEMITIRFIRMSLAPSQKNTLCQTTPNSTKKKRWKPIITVFPQKNPLSKSIELTMKPAQISAPTIKTSLSSPNTYPSDSSIAGISIMNKDFTFSANLFWGSTNCSLVWGPSELKIQ